MRNLLNRAMILALLLAATASAQHKHVAPHGGTLVALGEHFAHLEVRVDPEKGELHLWVLDGEAAGAGRIHQDEIQMKIRGVRDASGRPLTSETVELHLEGRANPLTGETRSHTSEFRGRSPALRGAARFEALIRSLEVRGVDVQVVRFPFPEGNEKTEPPAKG